MVVGRYKHNPPPSLLQAFLVVGFAEFCLGNSLGSKVQANDAIERISRLGVSCFTKGSKRETL